MKVVIIGCGASGIAAAIKAKNDNNEVIILEKNEKNLKKLLITGNGKCNYFNDKFDVDKYNSSDIDLLKHVINFENKSKLLDFMNSIGVVPRVKDGYYYPASNQAYSVYNSLLKEVEVKGVKIINNYEVKDIVYNDNKFLINNDILCDYLVISTGSKAYPKTGSDGIGYKFLEKFNHNINEIYPALVSVNSNDSFFKNVSGVRANCKVSLYNDNKLIKEDFGEVQFTDYGLSGICIYNLSVYLKNIDKNNYSINVNFLDEYNVNKNNFEEWINNRNSLLNNRNITEILESYLNYKIVNEILKKCKIKSDKNYNDLSELEISLLKESLLNYKFEISGTKDYLSSQVCGGGLSLKEIDLNNFMSNKINNLFVTGELLDVTGICGGYNLSFAFISGILVGEYINDKSK